jgi:hypothetical protein
MEAPAAVACMRHDGGVCCGRMCAAVGEGSHACGGREGNVTGLLFFLEKYDGGAEQAYCPDHCTCLGTGRPDGCAMMDVLTQGRSHVGFPWCTWTMVK